MSRSRYIKNFILKKYGMHRRDIFICILFFGIFMVSKNSILSWYLNFAAQKYVVNDGNSKKFDLQNSQLLKENAGLKRALNIPVDIKKKVIFGKVLNNIYSTSYFWVFFSDTSNIAKGQPVWHNDPLIGPRLIGFVDSLNKNYVKVAPVTHSSVRFSARTLDGIGILLKGNGINCKIILSNSESLKKDDVVIFEELWAVGLIANKKIVNCKEFMDIKVVCVSI